jgi:phage repressor protein C with HTH and peptisase S24 domain
VVKIDPRARLLQFAAERGASLSELSALIGRNPSYLQQFVRKGSPRKLDEGDRRKLARFLEVAEAELGGAEEISSAPGGRRPSEWVEIPRLALGASAGPGSFAEGEQPIGAFGFSAHWLRRQNLDPAMLSAIVVTGDSMEPVLSDGDEILVDRSPRNPRDGIHVVRLDEEALLVKRLAFGKPGAIVLISDNNLYPPIELPAQRVRVIGRVVWKSGRL